jgi:hypothetical protein
LVLPSQVHGGVRPYLDRLYQQTQDGTFSSMRQLLDALSVGEAEESESLQNRVSRLTSTSVTWTPPQSAKPRRLRSTLIAGLSVFIFGWLGWQLLTSNFYRADSGITILESPLPTVEVSQATGEIAAVETLAIYDPLGDNTENEDQVLFAIDGNKETAWTTDSYRKADMSGKAGVGLILDLGSVQDVYEVEVEFTSSGHSGEIYVMHSDKPNFATEAKFGDVNPDDTSSTVSVSNGVSGRYVLIWLTPDLPKSDSGEFQGGISEIKVRL